MSSLIQGEGEIISQEKGESLNISCSERKCWKNISRDIEKRKQGFFGHGYVTFNPHALEEGARG